MKEPERRKFRKGDLVKLRCWDDIRTAICISDEDDGEWIYVSDLKYGHEYKFTTMIEDKEDDGDVLLVRAIEDAPQEQPAPTPNDHTAVWDLVIADMEDRDALGENRYGTRLQPHNGRDALRDAYEEALDLCAYLRQAIYERDGK